MIIAYISVAHEVFHEHSMEQRDFNLAEVL